MKIAITGATGHIGSTVVPLLLQKGYKLRALLHDHQPYIDFTGIEIARGNLLDNNSLRSFIEGCDAVLHCAARVSVSSNADPEVYDINATGSINLFNIAKNSGIKKFVHISSIHAYNQFTNEPLLNEKSPYCNDDAPRYDQSKRDAQLYILANVSDAMHTVVLNPTSVTGPPDYRPSLAGKGMIDMCNNKVPSLINGGFDFCDVRDVAAGIVSAFEKGRNGENYLLSGHWHHLSEMHAMIMDAMGNQKKLPVLPIWTAYAGLPFISLFAKLTASEPLYTRESVMALHHGNRYISSAKAQSELGYKARPLKETITDVIEWFRLNKFINS